jgi:hypothetical protein
MPGMMRSRKSGCMCVDCSGPRVPDRASESREWKRLEWQQADPRTRWAGVASAPRVLAEHDDETLLFGYWPAMRSLDSYLEEP